MAALLPFALYSTLFILISAASVPGNPPARVPAPFEAASGEDEARPTSSLELSPSLGMMGGSPVVGLRASMRYHQVSVEGSAALAPGQSATLYPLTANLLIHLAESNRFLPYGLVGGGLFLTVPNNAVAMETLSTVGLNYGGGLRYSLSPALAVRFEVRQFFLRDRDRVDQSKILHVFQETNLGVSFAL